MRGHKYETKETRLSNVERSFSSTRFLTSHRALEVCRLWWGGKTRESFSAFRASVWQLTKRNSFPLIYKCRNTSSSTDAHLREFSIFFLFYLHYYSVSGNEPSYWLFLTHAFISWLKSFGNSQHHMKVLGYFFCYK